MYLTTQEKRQKCLSKWDEYRKKREIAMDNFITIFKKKAGIKNIIASIHLQKIILIVYQNMEDLRLIKLRRLYARMLCSVFFRSYRMKVCRPMGDDYEFRMINTIRRHIVFMCGAVMNGPVGPFEFKREVSLQKDIRKQIPKISASYKVSFI